MPRSSSTIRINLLGETKATTGGILPRERYRMECDSMADPQGYEPQYDFSNYQSANPSRPLPGHELDVELHNISDAIGGTQTALADIRRSDGKLKNGIVTAGSLSADALAALGPNGDLTADAVAAAAASATAAGLSATAADASADAASVSAAASAASAASINPAVAASYNVLNYTENFDNAAWAKTNITVTANATLAPDGTMTADKIVGVSGSSAKTLAQTQSVKLAAGTVATSVYAKAAERDCLQIRWASGATGLTDAYCNFNLTAGTINGTHTGAATMVDVGNGWWRLNVATAITGDLTNQGTEFGFVDNISQGRAPSISGDGSSGLSLWGAQTQQGAVSAYSAVGRQVITVGGARTFAAAGDVRTFGAVGDGLSDDTAAFVLACGQPGRVVVPAGAWNVTLTTANADVVLDKLKDFDLTGDLVINLSAGVYERSSAIILDTLASKRITLLGPVNTTATISAGTPVVTVNAVSGNRSTYDVRLPVVSSSGFSVGDWVVVKTSGVSLTYSSYDHTQLGARRNELDGFWEVVATTGTTITVRNKSRQSADKFPGGGSIAANTANFTGGTISKYGAVFKFTNCHGFDVRGDFGSVSRIAVVGDDSSNSGFYLVSTAGLATNYARSVGLYDVGIANFGVSGIYCEGAGATVDGHSVYSSGHGTHGFRVYGSKASIRNSIASGCGNTVGNGFFVSGGGELNCPNSIANGVRNSGFISNRCSTMIAESCISIGHGNHLDEVAGGWGAAEGKGYESEAGSRLYAGLSVALFCTELGFYSLAGSMLSCMYSVSSGHIHAHGYYCILGSTIQARYSVARGNGYYGFYAFGVSDIDAMTTRAESNTVADYYVIGAADIWAGSYVGSPVFGVPADVSGQSQIATTNTGAGTKLVLARGANLTIAADAITATHSYHYVDTEAAAATDNLATINGGVDGMVLVMRTVTSGRDVTIKHGTGNILLAGAADRVLTNLSDKITLIYDAVALKWNELAFADIA